MYIVHSTNNTICNMHVICIMCNVHYTNHVDILKENRSAEIQAMSYYDYNDDSLLMTSVKLD